MSGHPRHQLLPAGRHSGVSSLQDGESRHPLGPACSSLSQRISTRDTQAVRMDGSVQERGSMPSVADHLQSKAESRQRSPSALKPTCTSRLHPFRLHYSLQRMIVVMLLEVGRGARCVLSQPGPVLSLTPRSVASLACHRRLKQHQVLPSGDPKGSKVYELSADPVFTDRLGD